MRTLTLALLCLFNLASYSLAAEPINILLITGGCCHDYPYQTQAMRDAFDEMKVPARWTVINEGGKVPKRRSISTTIPIGPRL